VEAPRGPLDRDGVLAVFESLEVELGLGEWTIDAMPWWDLVRYPFHLAVLKQAGLGENAPAARGTGPRGIAEYMRIAGDLLRAATTRSPFRGGPGPVLVVGHPRRRLQAGRWADLYADPLLPLLPAGLDVRVVEDPLGFGHRVPAATPDLRWLDVVKLRARLAERGVAPLPDDARGALAEVEARFAQALGMEVDLLAQVEAARRRWHSHYPVYAALLERLAPRCVLLVRSAQQEALVAAAKDLRIPVAELQHGSPARGKLNYDYGSGVRKRCFVDVFAAFGPFWTEDVRLPLEEDAIVDLGFPWLSQERSRHGGAERRKQLLVLSQPDRAEVLTEFCLRLAPRLPADVHVLFRPHPEERNDGQARFDRLRAAGIEVQDDPSVDLYALFAASRWQLGVYSTALYEGLAFGCACFVLRTAGSELMRRVVELGLARFVDDPADFDADFAVDARAAEALFVDATPARADALLSRLDEVYA
jgi:hypothetical protein